MKKLYWEISDAFRKDYSGIEIDIERDFYTVKLINMDIFRKIQNNIERVVKSGVIVEIHENIDEKSWVNWLRKHR